MAVTPIGNMIYVNQNMQVSASKQTDFQARLDAQNLAANEASNEKEKDIQEVRPTEETYKVDPEKEHEKDKKEQEQEAKESAEENLSQDNKNDEKNDGKTHLLDITA